MAAAHDPNLSGAVGRLGVFRAAGAALDLLRAHARPMALFWLVIVALNVAGALARRAAPAAAGPLGDLALNLGESVPVAFITLAMARTLLGAPAPWRLDRRGLVFSAFDLASSLVLWAWYWAGDFAGGLGTPLAVLGGRALWIAAGLAIWQISIRSSLWIFAQAARDPRMTLVESWRRMRKAAFAVLGASTLLAVVPDQFVAFALALFPASAAGEAGWWAAIVASAMGGAVFSVTITAVPAAVYRLRGGPEGDLAQVFD